MLMRLKQLLYSINPYQDLGILIRQIADLIVIFIACFLAVLFINSENAINEIFLQSLSLLLLLSLVFIPTFYINIYVFPPITKDVVGIFKSFFFSNDLLMCLHIYNYLGTNYYIPLLIP